MNNYVSLIIDIEKSRNYGVEERNEIQNFMSECVELLNQIFTEQIERFVTFSGGDELQGLFKEVTAAFLYFRIFEIMMRPVSVRAGIGVGEWTVKVEPGLSTQQDGPAYHRARKAIEEVHKVQLQNVKICSDGDDILANHLINAAISLKKQQIYMQNIVQVLVELLYPFATDKMKQNNQDLIKELLSIKVEYKLDPTSYNKGRTTEKENLKLKEIPIGNPIMIDGNMKEAEAVILKKNTSSSLSELLGCTRQNVDSIMKRGNINKIRELDFIALQYLEKSYGGETWN